MRCTAVGSPCVDAGMANTGNGGTASRSPLPQRGFVPVPPSAMDWGQIRMVLRNNWRLKRRAPCATLCEIVLPMLVTAVMILGFTLSTPAFVPANNYEQVVRLMGPSLALNVTRRAPTDPSVTTLLPLATQLLSDNPQLGALLVQLLVGGGQAPATGSAAAPALQSVLDLLQGAGTSDAVAAIAAIAAGNATNQSLQSVLSGLTGNNPQGALLQLLSAGGGGTAGGLAAIAGALAGATNTGSATGGLTPDQLVAIAGALAGATNTGSATGGLTPDQLVAIAGALAGGANTGSAIGGLTPEQLVAIAGALNGGATGSAASPSPASSPTANLQLLREQLCTTLGICITLVGPNGAVSGLEEVLGSLDVGLPNATGLDGITGQSFFELFQGVLPILPLDAFALLQRFSKQVSLALGCGKHVGGRCPQWFQPPRIGTRNQQAHRPLRLTELGDQQNAATRHNTQREERVTVQGPVKRQRPDGMSHRGNSC